MAFAGGGLNRASTRDSAPGPRFFVCAMVSVLLMFFDQRDGWSERIRYGLMAAAYPIQVVLGLPGKLWRGTADLFETRASLRAENEALRAHERELALLTLRFEALEQENVQLRALRDELPPLVSHTQLAEVIDAELLHERQRLVINKGASSGLYRSQPVVDTAGLLGQLFRVGPWSAEVMLITDPEHAVPVVVVRTGMRATVMGNDKGTEELDLPDVPVTADVKVGDVLVTSGTGGVFPAGVPVGVITESRRDPDAILAVVRARPRASIDRSRNVLALWFNAANPAAPVDRKLIESLPPPTLGQPVTERPLPPADPVDRPEAKP